MVVKPQWYWEEDSKLAVRYQDSGRGIGRIPGYYTRNNLYPGSYGQLQAQTRVSRRMHEGLSVDRNYGLDTTSDDLDSSIYSSPYYINGRYNSNNLTTQTGNSASVQGTKFLTVYGIDMASYQGVDQTTIKLWQGKQIRFSCAYNNKVVGMRVKVKNTDGCKGILSIYLSASPDAPILSETSIDLCQVSADNFEERTLYTMTPVARQANPKGQLYVRMEIWDEVDCQRSTNPYNTGRTIEIIATGWGNHEECVNQLGEKNLPVREQYNFLPMPSQPQIAWIYNEWESVPVNRIEGVDYGATVSKNGYSYDIFCAKNGGEAKLLIYDRQVGIFLHYYIPVDARTQGVNLVQPNEWIYYVDGYSALMKMRVGEWQPVQVVNDNSSLPEGEYPKNDPVIGASIITFHHNRIYLAGFRYDPNLVQFSAIGESEPEFDNYEYRFYSPGRSPYSTSTNPITAIVEYQSDSFMIATTGGYSLYESNANVENDTPKQISIYSDGGGAASAGDITSYRGIIYSFDPDEGIRRFTGSIWNKIPANVDSHIERVDMTKPRKLWGYAYKLYFNYTDKIDGRAKCMVWDMDMNYQQYPWFQDVDVPFCDVRTSDDYFLLGIHPEFPCVMQLYAEDTWRRLDSPIVFRRDTKYVSLPGNASDLILKRVFAKVIANAERWWWFGLSFDKHDLKPDRGVQAWYRMPCWDTEIVSTPVEDPFHTEAVYEQHATTLIALPNLNSRVISVQVRTQTKTFRAQANLVSILLEGQARSYN